MSSGKDEINPGSSEFEAAAAGPAAARFSALEAALEAAVKTLRDASAGGPSIIDALTGMRSEIAALAENAREVKTRIDKVDRKVKELSVRQEISGESVSAQARGVERLEEGLDALNAREGMSARKLKEALERLSRLEENSASMDKLKAGIIKMKEILENSSVSAAELRFCVRKMGAIEAAFAEFSGKIVRQESDQALAKSSMGDLENRLEYLSVILNRIREIVGKTPRPSK